MMFKFKLEPFPHQLEAFEKFKNAEIVALLMDMGMGKTKTAIDIASHKYLREEHDRVLVIAPTQVHPQWINEQLPIHCPVPWRGIVYKSKKIMKNLREMDSFLIHAIKWEELLFLTINFESFVRPIGTEIADRFFGTSNKPPIIILDEASRIKNPATKTARNIKKLARRYDGSCKMVITGTPAAKSPTDMWSLYDFLRKNYMKCSYTAFQSTYSIRIIKKFEVKNKLISVNTALDEFTYNKIHRSISGYRNISEELARTICNRFGLTDTDFWLIVSSKKFHQFKNLDELQEKIKPDTFALSKEEALELPEKIYQKIEFELNKEQKRIIKELKDYSVSLYDGKEMTLEMKTLLGLRVLQICGGFFSYNTDIDKEYESMPIEGKNKKLDFILHDIPEIGSGQFIVWAVFVPELEMLQEELSKHFSTELLSGSTPKSKRAEIVQDFKEGNTQGLISNPTVGGYGLNLQKASVQYWYSRNFRTEARLQAEDRSHRIGITKSPIYKDLLYNVSFEHAVLSSLKAGQNINTYFKTNDASKLFNLL